MRSRFAASLGAAFLLSLVSRPTSAAPKAPEIIFEQRVSSVLKVETDLVLLEEEL
jgi:hypothetical protein